ncbi:MAG: hypothetical protein NTX50_13775 [Candidatus Sumerlaeota bacterium]|nr:hypothetical protein [Candidatus Sumerlaeota bacterium]
MDVAESFFFAAAGAAALGLVGLSAPKDVLSASIHSAAAMTML